MDNIVIVGSSCHAKVIIDVVQKEGKYNIVGLLDRYRDVGEQSLDYPVLGTEDNLPELIEAHDLRGVLIGIGDNHIRSLVASRIQEIASEIPFVTAIHPGASIGAGTKIGEGCVVMAGATVNPCTSVGRFCILNTNSSLDHDSVLSDFASLAPGVITGGNCHIGEYSVIGIGSVLVHGIHIGEQTVIGAGSLVMKCIGSFVVAYGRPAKRVRERKAGDCYL